MVCVPAGKVPWLMISTAALHVAPSALQASAKHTFGATHLVALLRHCRILALLGRKVTLLLTVCLV
jgi:hypothetical protein